MLCPDQVLPFLMHDQQLVRVHACAYLREAHDPAPATAEDFWRSIDAYGPDASDFLFPYLERMPQTESSVQRTLQALRENLPDRTMFHLQHALQWVDLDLLERMRDQVLGCEQILPHVREHLKQRLELQSAAPESLWTQLLAHEREIEDRYVNEFDARISERLIEAIARHRDFAAERAMSILQDASIDDWREIFAVQIVEQLRMEPAVPLLIQKLEIDADFFRERLVAALSRIGTADVVHQIAAFYPGKRWDVRLYAHSPLGRIKRPQSEAALLRLLEKERKDDLAASLAADLCLLCTTPENLAMIREGILRDRFDPQIADLEEMVLAVGAMVGYEPPEAAEWMQAWEQRERRLAEAMRGLDNDFARENRRRWIEGRFEPRHRMPASPGLLMEDFPVPQPVRSESPKIGRNDPCPCGSGKKYKKCCLNAS